MVFIKVISNRIQFQTKWAQHKGRLYLYGRRQNCLKDRPVEDGVADADQGHHRVLAQAGGDVGRNGLPEVGEQKRNLKFQHKILGLEGLEGLVVQ